ncbi:MAG: T9SS type A sorting domain-containing protein [Chitinophagaceae bacterium]|nr:T9SS type A sorting domain-containing protein [Chitinophagaceae bacterium]
MKKLTICLLLSLFYCQSQGQCVSAFNDDFETGTISGAWQSGTGSYSASINNITPAEGNYNLMLNSLAANSFYQGRYVTFSPAQPTYVSYWMKTNNTTSANGYFVLGDNAISTNNGILFCYFNGTSSLRFFNSAGYNYPIAANTWYHVEAKNINWTTKAMDIYINGTLILANWAFRSTASTNVDQFHLFSLNTAIDQYDKIEIGSTPPLATLFATTDVSCFGGSNGTADIVVSGGASPIGYNWAPSGGSTANATGLASGIYTCTVTDANTCTSTTTAVINQPLAPVNVTSAVSPSNSVCAGTLITLNGTATGGTGAIGLTWTDGVNTPLDGVPFVASSNANYTVTATDANLCTATSTLNMMVNPLPNVTANPSSITVCENHSVTLSGGGAVSYSWTGGINDNTPFLVQSGGNYTVIGVDAMGCSNTAVASVNVTPWNHTAALTSGNNSMPGMISSTDFHPDNNTVFYTDPSCNMICAISDQLGANILGTTTATVTVDAGIQTFNNQPYLARHYSITPNSNGSATIAFVFTQDDFDDYNANNGSYPDLPTTYSDTDPNIANIRITQLHGTDPLGINTNFEVLTPSYVGTLNVNNLWEVDVVVTGFSSFYLHGVNPGNIALPAVVSSFTGRKVESANQLNWISSSEQNNAYFNLQHSTDGINFSTVAKINSKAEHGISSMPLSYSYMHTAPQTGHNYYRLQQVDIDGHSSIHAQVIDLIWGGNGSSVSLYPNPAKDILHIDLNVSNAQNTTVKIIDLSGRIVKQIQAKTEKGLNTLSINLDGISEGVYAVQVLENDALMSVSRVVINGK